ncbi:MAG: cofactor-independent phosphoglycerate mutase [Armatimonadota bacterium]
MKYLVVIADGMSDYPLEELGGQTPLQAAHTPAMDDLARRGAVGMVNTLIEDMPFDSVIANLSILGYDPDCYFPGRGPLEAVAMGISLHARDVAFRCNLVTSDGERLVDYSAGHVTTDEARIIIETVDDKLGSARMKFMPGVGYRHLLLWEDGPLDLRTFPPHDHVGERLDDILPVGEEDDRLRQMMWDSLEILDDHEINRRRRGEGLNPANMIWPWSQGRRPELPDFRLKYGITGAVISAVDLLKGIGKAAGMKVIEVPGATGYLDTNYRAKAQRAVEALHTHDLLYLHVEAPDEAGHMGDIEEKIKAIERIDEIVVSFALRELRAMGEWRVLVMPDHATPIAVRTHVLDPVPFVMCPPPPGLSGHDAEAFHEAAAADTGLHIEVGHELLGWFVA